MPGLEGGIPEVWTGRLGGTQAYPHRDRGPSDLGVALLSRGVGTAADSGNGGKVLTALG